MEIKIIRAEEVAKEFDVSVPYAFLIKMVDCKMKLDA